MQAEPLIRDRPTLAPGHRLRWLMAAFVVLSLTVYGRIVALEFQYGGDYRAVASEPIVRKQTVNGMRGRILARDGTVLAYDQAVMSLAIQYRWLEEPADPRWLRRTARSRLSPAQRRDKKQVAVAEQQVLQQRREVAHRLAALCGLTDAQWQARASRIQRRVETISASVNARHEAQRQTQRPAPTSLEIADDSLLERIGRSVQEALFALDDPPPMAAITVAEELTPHVVHEGLPLETVAEIQSHPERYPGAELTQTYRRAYPRGDLAAHVLGYLGVVNESELSPERAADDDPRLPRPDDWVGRAGMERRYDDLLRPRRGLVEEQLDIRGNVKSSATIRQCASGYDVVLTIDPQLQRTAQALLDQALARRLPSGNPALDRASGGAVIVLDIHSGDVLAAAAAPRFDPNAFVKRDAQAVEGWLHDPARPLFDRTVQMALPPGSVFKIISAAAILEAGVDPRSAVDCRGYLYQPEALRCDVFRHWGMGHGPVTLIDALARSCNVYFFHYAEQLGADRLVDWGARFGLAQRAGIDLVGEAGGNLTPAAQPAKSAAEAAAQRKAEARLIVVGQGPVTATPLQIARIAAAIANGGTLVTPHVAQAVALSGESLPADLTEPDRSSVEVPVAPSQPVPGLSDKMLAAIRRGLRQAVVDDEGTAHDTVDLGEVSIAGKTGTAETGGGRPAHAWFAGYAPADQPRVAFVVVLEYAGNAGPAAGPVVRHLVERMDELEYFRSGPQVARK